MIADRGPSPRGVPVKIEPPALLVTTRDSRTLPRDSHRVEVGVAAEALLSGRLDAVSWFPVGSYLPAMVFVGDPAPPTPPPPPTREVTELKPGIVERGEIPVVEIPGRWQAAAAPPKPQTREEPRAQDELKARGQPP